MTLCLCMCEVDWGVRRVFTGNNQNQENTHFSKDVMCIKWKNHSNALTKIDEPLSCIYYICIKLETIIYRHIQAQNLSEKIISSTTQTCSIESYSYDGLKMGSFMMSTFIRKKEMGQWGISVKSRLLCLWVPD